MKILQVIPAFPPSEGYGGAPVIAYEISKKLVQGGHKVTVYTTDANNKKSRLSTKYKHMDGFEVYYFKNISNSLAWHRLFFTPSMLPQLSKEIKKFDIIHLQSYYTFLNIATHHYAKRYGIPYIVQANIAILPIFQKQRLKKFFNLFWGYRILKDASKVIAATEMEIDEEKRMGVNEEKIALILPGYDVNYFSDLPDLGQFREKFGIKEKNIILFLARIHKIKGIDFLVKSFYELTRSRDDVILVIAGPDDGYKYTIEKLIEELNISNKVLFTGYLDGDEKLSAYIDATMLVQPSKYERFCGSPFEAILCNTPIIVTRNTGCGNFVHKRDVGYTVDYGNVNELRNTMEEILNNLPEAHIKTQRGKQYIMSNLTLEKQVEKYEKLYQSAIEGVK